jgi:hypothetical protein
VPVEAAVLRAIIAHMVGHNILDMDEVIAWLAHYGEDEAAKFVLQAVLDGQAPTSAETARASFRLIDGAKD